MQPINRICLWSGPRNISTAMMYSFAQREDTTVVDEPLYAHYLTQTPADAYHPGAQEVLQTMEKDGYNVVAEMMKSYTRPVVFFKQMAHHLVELDWSFLKEMKNIILTRDPRDMLPSYAKQIELPTLDDVGYKKQVELVDYFLENNIPFTVINSRQVLQAPKTQLQKLCTFLEIPFDQNMLTWEAGPRPEDGSWAKYWYDSVHRSVGFAPYRPKTDPFPEKLLPVYEECLPYYSRLMDYGDGS